MPEAPDLYLRLSVAENLECFAGLYESRLPRERIDRALRAVGLEVTLSFEVDTQPPYPGGANGPEA